MARLEWNDQASKLYETGLDRGVIYPTHENGFPWNGLVSVEEGSTGGENEPLYYDGLKFYNRVTPEDFSATINAYTYPDWLEPALGMQQTSGTWHLGQRRGLYVDSQPRSEFSMAYRTGMADGVSGNNYGYKIHIIYNATISNDSVTRTTLSDDVSPEVFSWDITTRPVPINGKRFSAHLVINSIDTDPLLLEVVENRIWGSPGNTAKLPDPNNLVDLFEDFEPTGYGYGPYGHTSYGHGTGYDL